MQWSLIFKRGVPNLQSGARVGHVLMCPFSQKRKEKKKLFLFQNGTGHR